jgi:hypothetical protein
MAIALILRRGPSQGALFFRSPHGINIASRVI